MFSLDEKKIKRQHGNSLKTFQILEGIIKKDENSCHPLLDRAGHEGMNLS